MESPQKKYNLDVPCWVRYMGSYISICSIYFICQNIPGRHFLLILLSVINDIVFIEIMVLKLGVTVFV